MYKIGDNIWVIKNFSWDGNSFKEGDTGTIKALFNGNNFYGIEWERNVSGHSGHGVYIGKPNHCWDVGIDQIHICSRLIKKENPELDYKKIDLIHCDSCNQFLCISEIDTIKDSEHDVCYTRKITDDEFKILKNEDVTILKPRSTNEMPKLQE